MPYQLTNLRFTRKDPYKYKSARTKNIMIGGRQLKNAQTMILTDAAFDKHKHVILKYQKAGVLEISKVNNIASATPVFDNNRAPVVATEMPVEEKPVTIEEPVEEETTEVVVEVAPVEVPKKRGRKKKKAKSSETSKQNTEAPEDLGEDSRAG